MNDTSQPGQIRLDSWKAIAAYLNREERTVQRWERELSLPVRRLPGRGRSVFAYTSEIDDWLKTRLPAIEAAQPAPARDARTAVSTPWRIAAVAALIVTAVLAWRLLPARASAEDLRMRTAENGIAAVDARGSQRWTYTFPAAYATHFAEDMSDPAQVAGEQHPAVYLATAFRTRRSDDAQEGGTLTEFDLEGREQRSFSFTDTVTIGGLSYGPPWVVTMFAVHESGGARRIAIAAHHAVWDAGIVTVLDEQLHRHGTFVHAGWIEQVQWLASDRLLIAGFSNAHDGGMVALLDAAAPAGIEGQGPEPRGSRYFCGSCGTGTPLRMAVMPRTELNRITASRFNRARIQVTPGRILARTIEVPLAGQAAIDALYEFTPSLDLVRASLSDHYWDYHRTLALQGTLVHGREQSAERDGPGDIQLWDRSHGWTVRKTH